MGKHTGFRWELIRELMAAGFPREEARDTVDAIFASIIEALRKGETVETPLGTFKVVPNEQPLKRRIRFRNRIATYGKERKVVVFEAKADWEGLV